MAAGAVVAGRAERLCSWWFFSSRPAVLSPRASALQVASRDQSAKASLSYLGLGVQEPVPAWGLMLQGGAEEFATSAPWIAIFPGLAVVLSVLGINLIGDALRDHLARSPGSQAAQAIARRPRMPSMHRPTMARPSAPSLPGLMAAPSRRPQSPRRTLKPPVNMRFMSTGMFFANSLKASSAIMAWLARSRSAREG
jgi:hypothetical protein